jgi:flagellar assembly protein FliH
MTLLSENAGGLSDLPIRLVNVGERGERSVSRLMFHSAEYLRTEMPEIVTAVADPVEAEARLQEEMTAVDVREESQARLVSTQLDEARAEARVEARRDWEKELERRIAAERGKILNASEEFRKERDRYFAGVEAEVVKLALAIAARVLNREAKLDPLLLAAVVRVALGKIAEGSATVLRLPVHEVEAWKTAFATGAESSMQLIGDERLAAGECVLETNVGRVELGVSVQLEEIERGFFDLLQQRPA